MFNNPSLGVNPGEGKIMNKCPHCGKAIIPNGITKTEQLLMDLLPTSINNLAKLTKRKSQSIWYHIHNLSEKGIIEIIGVSSEAPEKSKLVKRLTYKYAIWGIK